MLICDLGRPQEQIESFSGGPVDLQLLGIHAFLSRNEDLIFVDESPLPGRFHQPGPEFGMSNGDEIHSSLPNVLAVQIGNSILSYHIANIAPVQGDSSPLLKCGNNSRDALI